MKTLFIGSNNLNKLKEIKDIFEKNEIFVDIKSPIDFNDKSEVEENGFSFKENSKIKAKYYYDRYHIPCIGEDSGITIEYFNNLPGIHSKRFLGNLNDYDKNNYVLHLMKYIENRKAVFHTSICYIDEDGKEHYFEGVNEGEIAHEQRGNEGFGYDPIFLIPEFNKTEAELGLKYKNENGHRSKAIRKFIDYIKENE